MMIRLARVFALLVVMAAQASAQHGGSARTVPSAPPEARQFAFLIGQHELVVKPKAVGLGQKIHGVPKLIGTWKAWRAMDGFGIEDELRVTDEAGNPNMLSHATRYYDATTKRWTSNAIDVYRGVMSASTGEWRDNALVTSSRGTDAEGKPYLSRTKFYDIKPASFKFRIDRSTDDGRTWTEGVLSIDGKRVAAGTPR